MLGLELGVRSCVSSAPVPRPPGCSAGKNLFGLLATQPGVSGSATTTHAGSQSAQTWLGLGLANPNPNPNPNPNSNPNPNPNPNLNPNPNPSQDLQVEAHHLRRPAMPPLRTRRHRRRDLCGSRWRVA